MSTPSSIVGEQYSTGSSAVAERAPRAPRVSPARPGRCARGPPDPRRASPRSRVELDEERVDPALAGGVRHADRVVEARRSPVAGDASDQAEAGAGSRAAARAPGVRSTRPAPAIERSQQVADDALASSILSGCPWQPGKRVAAAQALPEAAAARTGTGRRRRGRGLRRRPRVGDGRVRASGSSRRSPRRRQPAPGWRRWMPSYCSSVEEVDLDAPARGAARRAARA